MVKNTTTKKELMDKAAIELFACKGLSGTTIKDIAKKAGVTEGALYRHYASKEEMALVLFEREQIRIRDVLLQSFDPHAPLKTKFRTSIEYLYNAYASAPYPLLFVIQSFMGVQGNTAMDEKEHIYDFIIGYTKQLLEHHGSKQEPEFLATLITGVIVQPILFHHYGKLDKHPITYIDAVTETCCRMTGA